MRRRKRETVAQHLRGFTLLEILIVLALIGMTSAIVFPRLGAMGASFEFATQRDNFERTLDGLAYKAFRENNDVVLEGEYTHAGREETSQRSTRRGDGISANLRTRSLLPSEQREHLPPVNAVNAIIPLPSGWRLIVEEPIYIRGSGYCNGGRAELYIGTLQYSYELRPPLCRAELVE